MLACSDLKATLYCNVHHGHQSPECQLCMDGHHQPEDDNGRNEIFEIRGRPGVETERTVQRNQIKGRCCKTPIVVYIYIKIINDCGPIRTTVYFFFPLAGAAAALPFEFQDEPFFSVSPAFASAIFAASAPFFFLFMFSHPINCKQDQGDEIIFVKEHQNYKLEPSRSAIFIVYRIDMNNIVIT